MASKKKPNSRGEILQQEDVLQAVVITDSFNVRFAPITKQKPRTLLPLANVPLLDYTLQFLVESGIQEIFVYCCAHAEQIKAHIRSSRWVQTNAPYTINTIVSEDCMSVGDALRDLDGKSVLKSDFVLVSGDLVSNVKLGDIIAKHKERRLVDKQCVMTMVMQRCAPGGASRCAEEDVVVAVDSASNRVLHYQKMAKTGRVDLAVDVLLECPRVRLRYDLLDCQISICAPLVAPLFSDNFDYQTRDAFVHGILVNEEILGNTIYTHILGDEYAVRVSNLDMYDAVSQDVLSRWVYPIVPDNLSCSVPDRAAYIYGRHNIYTAKDVNLERDSRLVANVMIGPGSHVGSCTIVSQSVIGRNCRIGSHCRLTNVYAWDHVTIEDGCTLTAVVLCDGAVVKRDSTIAPGSVLAYDVVVGPNATVPAHTALVSSPKLTGIDDPLQVHGAAGRAFIWQPSCHDDDDDDDEAASDGDADHAIWGVRHARVVVAVSDDEDTEVSDNDGSDVEDDVGSDEDGAGPTTSPQPDDDATVFYTEVMNTLERAEEENLDADNIILEINSLKHAYNITIKEVNQFVIKAIMDYPLRSQPDMDQTKYLNQLIQLLKRWLSVLRNYIKRKESHLESLAALEEHSLKRSTMRAVFLRVVHYLYDEDVLAEEAILYWYENPPSKDQALERQQIRKQMQPFIKWLQEADEESEEEN